ncbi:hypothetical protein L3073_15450 [Ancylomarina sp. DW003]|nr:hypothetical protein [Ancylomarina sp. DW003]MDE5423614.1 hypothetical protein [Ancylomarina sp. DW003]
MGRPYFKIIGLLIVAFSILIFVERRREKDIEVHGFENSATVNYYKYVSYFDNARSKNRISFYRIGIDYQYNGNDYSVTIELQPNEFNDKIGYKLNIGDEISIKHSSLNPKNVILN